MADDLHIGGDFLAALDDYAQDVTRSSYGAAAAGVDKFQQQLRADARDHPRWTGVADSIEAWDEGGRLAYGVRNQALHEAMDAEFGDADNAPVALIRTAHRAKSAASQAMDDYLRSQGY